MRARFDADAVRALLAQAVADAVFPSAVLLVADAGEVLLADAVGDATPETVYDLASLTKPLATTTILMRMHEAGLVALEAPVRDALPELANPDLRVWHLLAHAAGFPDHRRYWEDPTLQSREAVFARALAEPLLYAPGTKSVYSDVGFMVLGALIERVSGARLDVLWEVLAPPDGLDYGPAPGAAPTEVAADGQPLVGVVHDENARAMGGVAPHAGLFGSATAVHEWLSRLMTGELVSAGTRARFFAPAGVPGSTWGLGWDHPNPTGPSAAGSRLPRTSVGHLGFTGCSIWIEPARPFWMILLTNRVHPTRANERIRAFRPILADAVCAAAGLY
jgi:CubicO group peptidase (beta-lactamase class C family)